MENDLKKRLVQIEEEIRAYKKQMPAHSVKPVMMERLIELENERDALIRKISTTGKSGS